MKNLPKDIRNAVTLKFIKKLLFAVVWYLFVSFALVYYQEQLKVTILEITPFYVVLLYIVIGIVLLFPFIAVSVHHVFIDRNWRGVITKKIIKLYFLRNIRCCYPRLYSYRVMEEMLSHSGLKLIGE